MCRLTTILLKILTVIPRVTTLSITIPTTRLASLPKVIFPSLGLVSVSVAVGTLGVLTTFSTEISVMIPILVLLGVWGWPTIIS